MKVLVILGGNSPEREVSIRSGKVIAQALKNAGHEVEEFDPANGLEQLAKLSKNFDCAFPILHGVGGEDGEIQDALEKYNFEYLGSNPEVSRLCFDKADFKETIQKLGIKTPKWQLVNKETIKQAPIDKPYVLKPPENGSAIDLTIVRNPGQQSYPENVFDHYPEMLFEELIIGHEITVAILDDKALPVVEIIPPEGEEFDYENKYNGKTQELCPPANVSNEKQQEAQAIIEKIHKAVGARHLSRTDIMVGQDGELYVLDFNTMPGLTDQSLFPKAAQAAGMTMEQLVQKLLDLVMSE